MSAPSIAEPLDEDWFDDDIKVLALSYPEKAGLQIYRNYTRSFENDAIARFKRVLEIETLDLSRIEAFVELLMREDIRFAPIVLCGFADETLKALYQVVIPSNVPGGRKDLLSGFGPLGTLSSRIKLAFAFDLLSQDLLTDLEQVRNVRNCLSHDWQIKTSDALVKDLISASMFPVEEGVTERRRLHGISDPPFNPEQGLRIRLIWVAGRLFYEAAIYQRAKDARVRPDRVLYEQGGTAWLAAINKVCMAATDRILS